MNPENEAKLRRRIAAAGTAAVAKNGYATAIDALLGTGWLPAAHARRVRQSQSGNGRGYPPCRWITREAALLAKRRSGEQQMDVRASECQLLTSVSRKDGNR
jgi:hypothetical protein